MLNLNDLQKIKVNQLENKNQFIIQCVCNGHILLAFQSYRTLIAIWDYTTKDLYINWLMWDYSKTTSKHLKIFVNRFTSYTYNNKHQFLKEIIKSDNNIITFKSL